MGPQSQRRGMVRQEQYAVFSKVFHAFHHVAHNQLIKVLYGLKLMLKIAGMTCLVRGLNVQIYKIHFFQSLYRSIGLSLIVGINPACATRDIQNLKAGIYAESFGKIYC